MMQTLCVLVLVCAGTLCTLVEFVRPDDDNDNSAPLKHINSSHQLADAIQSVNGSVFLFVHRDDLSRYLNRSTFEKAAIFLMSRNIQFYFFVCSDETNDISYCTDPDKKFAVFRNGRERVHLSEDNLRTTAAVVSEVLHFVLRVEIRWIGDGETLRDLRMRERGKHHVVVSYFRTIGGASETAKNHAAYLDMYYDFHQDVVFIITQNITLVQNLGVDTVNRAAYTWVYPCKYVDKCEQVIHYDDDLNVAGFSKFLTALSCHPSIDYSETLCTTLSTPYVWHGHFYYDAASESRITDIAYHVADFFLGYLVVQLHRANDEILKDHLVPSFSLFIPAASVGSVELKLDVHSSEALIDYISEERTQYYQHHRKKQDTEKDSVESYPTEERVNDEVYLSVIDASDRNPIFNIDKKSFENLLELWPTAFIIFHLSFDAFSRAALYNLDEAVTRLAEEFGLQPVPVAGVLCNSWPDICEQYNITIHYPTMLILRHGEEPVEYEGRYESMDLIRTVKLFTESQPLELTSVTQVEDYITGTDIDKLSPFSVMGVFSHQHINERNSYLELVKQRRGFNPFSIVQDETVVNEIASALHIHSPTILVFNRFDPHRPVDIYHGDHSLTDLIIFLQQSSIPIFSELSVDIFPAVYTLKRPLLVLFTAGQDQEVTEVNDALIALRKSPRFKHSIFTFFADVLNDKLNLGFLLAGYSTDARLPALVMIDLHKGHVFEYTNLIKNKTSSAITGWVESCLSGERLPTSELKEGVYEPQGKSYNHPEKLGLFKTPTEPSVEGLVEPELADVTTTRHRQPIQPDTASHDEL